MGPAVPIAFFAILGLLAGTATAALLVAKRVKAPRWTIRWAILPLGCCAAPILGGLLVLAGLGLVGAFMPAGYAFQKVFGRSPSTAITGLQSSADDGWDYEDVMLGFDRSDAAFKEAVRGRRFRPLSPDSAGLEGQEEDFPSWWHGARASREHDCPGGHAFDLEGENGWRETYLMDCPSRRKIYVLARNID